MRARIVLAGSEVKAGGSICAQLELEGYRVDVVSDVGELMLLAGVHSYAAIILDMTNPTLGGLVVVQGLRRARITAAVLALSASDNVEDRVRVLDSGVDDVLATPFSTVELMARLRALLRRQRPQTGNLLRVADLELDLVSHDAMRGGESIDLTRREFDLLGLLMRASPRPVKKAEIIAHVWSQHADVGSNVVNVYIGNLRRKIDREHFTPLIHTVRGVGFCCKELL